MPSKAPSPPEQAHPGRHRSRENDNLLSLEIANMPARMLEPLNYTTPPFAAVSGIVEYEAAQTTVPTSTETAKPGKSRPALQGPWWAMFAVAVVVLAVVGMSIAWWKTHKARLARGYYNNLGPVSNYREWRERQATKLLRSTTSSSVTPSRRGSGSQQSAIPMYESPSSSSPASSRD